MERAMKRAEFCFHFINGAVRFVSLPRIRKRSVARSLATLARIEM